MPVPPIDQQSPPATTQPAQERHVDINARGQIYFDGRPVTIDELKALLTAPPESLPSLQAIPAPEKK